MRPLSSPKYAFLVLALLVLLPSAATADPIWMSDFCQERPEPIGSLRGQPLQSVVYRGHLGGAYYYYFMEVRRIRPDGGTEKVLVHLDSATEREPWVDIAITGDTLTWATCTQSRYDTSGFYGCSDERYQWQPELGRFTHVDTAPPQNRCHPADYVGCADPENNMARARERVRRAQTNAELAALPRVKRRRRLRQAHERALTAYRAGRVEEALEVLRPYEALMRGGLEVREPAAVHAANDYAFFMSQPKRAQRWLEAVLDADPNRAVAHLNLADVLMSAQEYAAAFAHYRSYARLRREAGQPIPERIEAWLRLGSRPWEAALARELAQRPGHVVALVRAWRTAPAATALAAADALWEQGYRSDAQEIYAELASVADELDDEARARMAARAKERVRCRGRAASEDEIRRLEELRKEHWSRHGD